MAKGIQHLRCSLIWKQCVFAERTFAPGSKVTVGEHKSVTFQLQTPLGNKKVLFRVGRSGGELLLHPGIQGQLSLHGKVRDIKSLTEDDTGLTHWANDVMVCPISTGDRGVLVCGEVGLSFDFVDQEERFPRADIRNVLGADRTTSRIFGAGLGLVFMLVLVSRLFASPVTEFTVEQLPDRFVSFITDSPESANNFRQEMKRRKRERVKKKTTRKKEASQGTNDKKTKTPQDKPSRRIRKRVSTEGVVGAISIARRRKGALSEIFSRGGLGSDLSNAVAALDKTPVIATTGGSGLNLTTLNAGRLATSRGDAGNASGPQTGVTGRRTARSSRLESGGSTEVVLSMPAAAANVSGGGLSKQQISRVVQRNKGAIRYCYESQLTRFPTLRGKVVVDFFIELDGSVKTVKVPTNGLSNKAAATQVISCLIRFIRRWSFPKPKGSKVQVIYPFNFGRTR